MSQTYTIYTPIMPYVRMTQRGKWAKSRAQAYLSNQIIIRVEIDQQMSERGYTLYSNGQRLKVDITVVVPRNKARRGDIDNIAKAILDAMQGRVYENDVWIDWLVIQRGVVNDDQSPYCRVEVEALD